MMLDEIRKTSDRRLAGGIRLALAVLFLITGAMKLLVPVVAGAWSDQLQAAQIPMYSITRWMVPFIEIALGGVLAVGTFVRPAAVVVIGIMAVATYVHLIIDDPSLFPLQPSEPIIPLAVIMLSAYVLWQGGRAWSKDLKAVSSAAGLQSVPPMKPDLSKEGD